MIAIAPTIRPVTARRTVNLRPVTPDPGSPRGIQAKVLAPGCPGPGGAITQPVRLPNAACVQCVHDSNAEGPERGSRGLRATRVSGTRVLGYQGEGGGELRL